MVFVSTFRTEMMLELGYQTEDADQLSLVLAWIQEGVDVIFNFADWADFMEISESLPTVQSQVSYTPVAANIDKIVSIRLSANDSPLTFYTRQELEESGLDLESEGEPRAWYPAVEGGIDIYSFNLYPVPDAVYDMTIVEIAASSDLSAFHATLPLPQQFKPALKEYIRAVAFYNDGKVIEGQRADGRFNNQLSILRKKILQPANHTRLAVTDMPGGRNLKWQTANRSHFNNRKW